MTDRRQFRMHRIRSLMLVLAVLVVGALRAQEWDLSRVARGELATGVPETFTVRAGGGDFWKEVFESAL
jgi:hypothetical protein